jgi:hypothetical protein
VFVVSSGRSAVDLGYLGFIQLVIFPRAVTIQVCLFVHDRWFLAQARHWFRLRLQKASAVKNQFVSLKGLKRSVQETLAREPAYRVA